MKKILLIILVFTLPIACLAQSKKTTKQNTTEDVSSDCEKAQKKLSNEEIFEKHIPILKEADRLYKYERAAWVGSDIALMDENIKSTRGYIVIESEDTIKTIFYDKEKENCIIEICFLNDFDTPIKTLSGIRKLSPKEKELIEIQKKVLNQITKDTSYHVSCPEGYSLNLELLPNDDGYNFYIFTGTSQDNIIPFGNDWIFSLNKNGEITSWRKYHSILISINTNPEEKITTVIHSHLKKEPYMTPTDICTFRLYAKMFGLESMYVYSPAIEKYLIYTLKENTIIVLNKEFFENLNKSIEERKAKDEEQ